MPFDGARIMYNTRICIKPILGKFAHFCLKKSVLAYKFMHLPSVAAGGPNRKIHQKLNLSHHQTYRVYRDRVTYLIHSSYIRLRYRKNMPLKEVARFWNRLWIKTWPRNQLLRIAQSRV